MRRVLHPRTALVGIVAALALSNVSSTFLSGWDNLHPEFHLLLNLKRSVFSVWEEYQGLGLLAGNGHAAELPRQILILLLSLPFPVPFLRQVFIFASLLLGGLGTYKLISSLLKRDGVPSLMGSSFYLLNLATVQTFYAPFEPFLVHYALLPWLFLFTLRFVEQPRRQTFLLFTFLSIAAIPQGHVPTMFLVYLTALSFFLLSFSFMLRTKEVVKRGAVLLLTTLILNAFWFLPFLYFAATRAHVPMQAKINQMGTEDVFLQNRAFGNLKDVALLKGFWFDNVEPDQNGVYAYMLQPWKDHLATPTIAAIGYLLFATVLLGFATTIKRRSPPLSAFAVLFFFAFTMLTTTTPPFSWIHTLLREHVPLFAQVFRFPFTKFSVLAALTYAVFFAVGVAKLERWKIVVAASFALLIVFLFPAFRGHLFYDRVRTDIPKEYFQFFDFFSNQNPHTRIANFPQSTFWGWNFYRFGYRGSGFLWYGIEQPILDRAFDVWSPFNENYYHELSYALYSKNRVLFEKVLEKYQVDWVLVDRNVVNPSSPRALFFYELDDILTYSEKFTLAKTFGNIKIYRVNRETKEQNFVFLAENLPTVGPIYAWNNYDRAYLDHGIYISSPNPASSFQLPASNAYYPFRSLFTGRSQEDLEFTIEDEGETLLFKGSLPRDVPQYYIEVPQGENEEGTLPEVLVANNFLSVRVAKKADATFTIDPASDQTIKTAKNCNLLAKGTVENEVVEENGKKFVRLTAVEGNNCSAAFFLPNLSTRKGYLIAVEHRNILGKSLFVWLENNTIRKADIETYLPKAKDWTTSYFIQPPMEEDGIAYTLHFENISIGKDKTINELASITVQPIPYEFLAGLAFRQGSLEATAKTNRVNVGHPNPSLYVVDRKQKTENGKQTLVLSQSFDPGWKAYHIKLKTQNSKLKTFLASSFPLLFGRELKEHVLVNNWANGWLLPSSFQSPSSRIIILYLPQYLQYFGFAILLATFVGLTVRRKIW